MSKFLPDVSWAAKLNTISCSAAHHFYEGRWLRDRKYLDDYARFWFRKGGNPRLYSFWAADAIRSRALVTQDQQLAIELLPDLVENYREWEKTRLPSNHQQLHVRRRGGAGRDRQVGWEKRPFDGIPNEGRQNQGSGGGPSLG